MKKNILHLAFISLVVFISSNANAAWVKWTIDGVELFYSDDEIRVIYDSFTTEGKIVVIPILKNEARPQVVEFRTFNSGKYLAHLGCRTKAFRFAEGTLFSGKWAYGDNLGTHTETFASKPWQSPGSNEFAKKFGYLCK